MYAKNTNMEELETALYETNKHFDNNIMFMKLERKGNNIIFRLRVHDSKGKGARRGPSGRRTVAACWHVHGVFFDNLFKINNDAVIKSRGKTITREYGNWKDNDVGSLFHSEFESEMCECS